VRRVNHAAEAQAWKAAFAVSKCLLCPYLTAALGRDTQPSNDHVAAYAEWDVAEKFVVK